MEVFCRRNNLHVWNTQALNEVACQANPRDRPTCRHDLLTSKFPQITDPQGLGSTILERAELKLLLLPYTSSLLEHNLLYKSNWYAVIATPRAAAWRVPPQQHVKRLFSSPQALPHLALVSIITHSIPPSRHPQLLCDLRRPWFPLKLLAVIFRYIIISSSRTSWHPTEWLLRFPFRSRPVNVFWPTYDAMAQQRQI